MDCWQTLAVGKDQTIKSVIEVIDAGRCGLALVTENNQLCGTVTDGDVRRGILKNISLDAPVSTIMNADPITAYTYENRDAMKRRMQTQHILQLPVLNAQEELVELVLLDEFISQKKRDNVVVIMAGGEGQRLRPLTQDCPKPLLPIDSQKPVLEILLEQCIKDGFHTFYFALNYRGEMIKHHFGDGQPWGVTIHYLEEEMPLGTAGALSLLPQTFDLPVIVMNGDIMTQINFQHLLNFHKENGADLSVCVREYQQGIPYGVVELDDHKLVSLHEKPTHSFFVNAGIYVVNPQLLAKIPSDTCIHMPDFIEQGLKSDLKIAAFPIREYWLDIGQMKDYQQAHTDYQTLFATQRDSA